MRVPQPPFDEEEEDFPILRGHFVPSRFTARRIQPIAYHDTTDPRTPQAEIDTCLECPSDDCRKKECALVRLGVGKWIG